MISGTVAARLEVSVVLRSSSGPGPLRRALEALCRQSLPSQGFEVVVVAEGADAPLREVVTSFEPRLAVRLASSAGAGVAATHDQGLSLATGDLVLFLCDREVADPGLLLAHCDTHRRHPEDATAVLGAARLSDVLARDPLMHYAAEEGCFLYAQPYVKDGDVLDFTSFWPERCSLKRRFLLEHGAFDPRFRRGDDHVELGFRLGGQGFRVVHAAAAISTLVDGFDLDELRAWLRDQGASRYLLAKLHPTRAAQEAAGVEAAREGWPRWRAASEVIVHSARRLDNVIRRCLRDGLPVSGEELALLHRSYWAALTLARLEGMAEEAAAQGEELAPRSPAAPPPAGSRTEGGGPRVSIVIPVHGKWEYTRRCLEAIAGNTPAGLHEIVVVDDASRDETAERLRHQPSPVRVLANEANLGFVGSCNRGAAVARGEWILFLNNDTEPRPGWLAALLSLAEATPRAGAVGSRLIYGNGTLQEAGGLIFRDGLGWNFGRGDAPGAAAYQRACKVDYCSGASLMVRRDLFERLGGFDPRFAPGYYEDADLCFGIRSLGYEVFYCPGSVVVHHEGITSGTDTSTGMKRFQVVNHGKFVAKWRETLARQDRSPAVTGQPPRTADRSSRLAAALLESGRGFLASVERRASGQGLSAG